MDMNRIAGALFSGFAMKVYAAGMALWIASSAASVLAHSLGALSQGLAGH